MNLIAIIEPIGNAGYIAWIDGNTKIKAVVRSETVEGVLQELLTSLRVKIAYDYGISIDTIVTKQVDEEQDVTEIKEKTEKPINFGLNYGASPTAACA